MDKRKYGFEVFFDNYFTNVETDFILDVPTSCLIFFTTDTAVPTVQDLYELYLKANHSSGWEIVKEANKRNLKADFMPLNCIPPAKYIFFKKYIADNFALTYNCGVKVL